MKLTVLVMWLVLVPCLQANEVSSLEGFYSGFDKTDNSTCSAYIECSSEVERCQFRVEGAQGPINVILPIAENYENIISGREFEILYRSPFVTNRTHITRYAKLEKVEAHHFQAKISIAKWTPFPWYLYEHILTECMHMEKHQ